MKPGCLVIDQGGHSSRVIVFDSEGDIVASVATPVATLYPQPGFAEQDVDEVVKSVDGCLQQLAEKLSAQEMAAIGPAALIVQRSSFLACRKSDLTALTPIISWQDSRNRPLIDALEPRHDKIREKTGLRPNAHYGASKMRWLLDNDPAVKAAANSDDLLFVPLAAWLAYRLVQADRIVVDPVIASRTLLCQLGSMEWDDELLSLFGIPRTTLPAIVASDYPVGELTVGNKKAVDKKVTLALVGGDQSFIAFASGATINHGDVYVNVGTGAFIQTLAGSDHPQVDRRLLCSPAVITATNRIIMAEGTVNSASTALDWLWQQLGKSLGIEQVNRAFATVTAPPLFINTLLGTGSPWWLPHQEPSFEQRGQVSAAGELAIAVLESIVFALAENFFLLQANKPALQRIVISGGLASYDGFCQKLASLTSVEVVRPASHEASARGAALFLMNKTIDTEKLQLRRFSPVPDQGLGKRYRQVRQIMDNLGR